MIFLLYLFVFYSSLKLLVAVLNVVSLPVLKLEKDNTLPFISVLIPARNEAGRINNLLKSLKNQDYWNLEILVLDDHSSDETAEIVNKFSQEDSRVRLIKGRALPE